jgi:hypothetical protein
MVDTNVDLKENMDLPANSGGVEGLLLSLLSTDLSSGSKRSAMRKDDPIPVTHEPTGPTLTAGSMMLDELRATGFIGMWKDREDMRDSTAFVQRLREEIQVRADRVPPEG